MLAKSAIKPAQDLANKRELLLASQEATNLGGVMRGRAFPTLAGQMDPSQFGDGFGGASCEMASLLVHGISCAGSATKLTVVKIYVDVVQAYASIMASISLPLDGSHTVARARLATFGFGQATIDGIIEDSRRQTEWNGTAEHTRAFIAAFQRSQ